MRSVILKGTEIACINYLILSRQTYHKILKLFCDYGEGENGQTMGGKGPLDRGRCPCYVACQHGEDHKQRQPHDVRLVPAGAGL